MSFLSSGEFSVTDMRPVARVDRRLIELARRYGLLALRVSIGLVYIWFGLLKFFPGLSPAEPLVRATMEPFVSMSWFLPVLALWETAIGIGFVTGKWPRVTIALMLLQMGGAMSPLLLTPGRIWVHFPFVWTLEGQYVFKDIILVSAALVIFAGLRGKGKRGNA